MQYTIEQYIETKEIISLKPEYNKMIDALDEYEQYTANQKRQESSTIDILDTPTVGKKVLDAQTELWKQLKPSTRQSDTQIDPLYKETALLLIISNKINNETQDKDNLYKPISKDENTSNVIIDHYPSFEFNEKTKLWHPICSQCKKNDGIIITMKFGKKLSTSETWFCDKNEIVHKPMALGEILGTLGIHIKTSNYCL